MKWILSVLFLLFISVAYATFTTRDGVVLLNCTPKMDPESKSQCESINNYNQLEKMNDFDPF